MGLLGHAHTYRCINTHIIFFFFDNELKLYVLRFNSVEGPVDLASLEKSRSYESSRDYIGEMWGFEKQQEE
jgi:hypothetical protein